LDPCYAQFVIVMKSRLITPHKSKRCITGPKVCTWMGTMKHILDGQRGSQGKKEVGNSFVLPTITTTYYAHIMVGAIRLP
jgi:hypothetical protein